MNGGRERRRQVATKLKWIAGMSLGAAVLFGLAAGVAAWHGRWLYAGVCAVVALVEVGESWRFYRRTKTD